VARSNILGKGIDLRERKISEMDGILNKNNRTVREIGWRQ
jgi:hypothetical protein